MKAFYCTNKKCLNYNKELDISYKAKKHRLICTDCAKLIDQGTHSKCKICHSIKSNRAFGKGKKQACKECRSKQYLKKKGKFKCKECKKYLCLEYKCGSNLCQSCFEGKNKTKQFVLPARCNPNLIKRKL